MNDIISTELLNWVIIPICIFLARVVDVTLGTMKVIYVTQGHRLLASLLGLVETFIWLVAIGQVMQNLSTWTCYLGWALGYSLGIFVGITAVKFIQSRKVTSLSQQQNIFLPAAALLMDKK